jgi:hypothetical protein
MGIPFSPALVCATQDGNIPNCLPHANSSTDPNVRGAQTWHGSRARVRHPNHLSAPLCWSAPAPLPPGSRHSTSAHLVAQATVEEAREGCTAASSSPLPCVGDHERERERESLAVGRPPHTWSSASTSLDLRWCSRLRPPSPGPRPASSTHGAAQSRPMTSTVGRPAYATLTPHLGSCPMPEPPPTTPKISAGANGEQRFLYS